MANTDWERRLNAVEDKVDNFKVNLHKTAENLSAISGTLTEIKTHLKWHRWAGEVLAATYAAAFVWLMTSYVPEKLNDRVPSDFKESWGKLQQNVSDIQGQLNRLTPTTLKQLIPSENTSTKPEVIISQLTSATKLIDVALRSKIPGDPEMLSSLRPRLGALATQYRKNRQILRLAMATDVRVDGYAIASRRLLDGLEPITERTSQPINPGHSAYLLNVKISCVYPTAEFLGIGPPFERKDVVVVDASIYKCRQQLDGVRWINNEFHGATLEYRGGALYLAGVKFVECTYKFGDDPKSKEALAAISASKGEPVNLLLPE